MTKKTSKSYNILADRREVLFDRHLQYDVDMLRATYDAMLTKDRPLFLNNALIETFCVHARNITDFFKEKSDINPFIVQAAASTTGGAAVGSGEVTTKLSFSTAWSSYCRVKDATYDTIRNQDGVNAKIMEAFEKEVWHSDFAYVHGVFKVKSSTIISSSSDGAEIDLSGKIVPGQALDLADARAGITTKNERGISEQIVAGPGLTPFMCLSGLRPKNRVLALIGLSPRRIETYFQAEEAGPSTVGSHNAILRLEPDISMETVKDLEIAPGDAFHVVEI